MIHQFQPGQDIRSLTDQLNQMVDACNAFLSMSGGGLAEVNHTAGGCTVSVSPEQIGQYAPGTAATSAAAAANHNLLNFGTHPDTANKNPVKGDLVLGTVAGMVTLWDRLPIGSAAQVLTVDAFTAKWKDPATELPASSSLASGTYFLRLIKGSAVALSWCSASNFACP